LCNFRLVKRTLSVKISLMTFIYLINLYWLFRTIQQLFGVRKTLSFLREWREKKLGLNRKIAILIPIYRENRVLREALKFWSSSRYSPIFITTEREGNPDKNRSYQIVKNFSNFRVIHSPNISGYKASQLNYAISELENIDYIAIFDVDSRPDLKGLEFVEESGEEAIYQMFSLFTGEYNKNSNFGKASSIFHTRRVLAFEIPAMLNGDFSYLIGHGLIVRRDIFREFRFSEETIAEDLIFGYQTHLSGTTPSPLPYFDLSSSPDSPRVSIPQGGRWFLGDLLFPKFVEIKLKDFEKILSRYLHILDWLWGSIATLFALSFGDIFQVTILLSTLLLFLYLHKFAVEITRVKFGIYLLPYLLFRMAINSFAPIYGIWRAVLEKLGLKSFHFEKTEKE
jgi:cellulose synthase/poly-beta-1,6-N-acetylglucosamine synthase-like glycosyltransferase